jgi:outer membrane murein-binding lipoprotein Lpp
MKGEESGPPTGRILIDYIEVKPNAAAPEGIWLLFEALPSQTRPQRGAKPAKRLTALAHELASDGILAGAGKLVHTQLHEALDAFSRNHQEKITAKRKAVLTVDGKTVVADLKGKEKSFDDFWEDADVAVIDDAYHRAARILSPDVARTYVEHLARKTASLDDDPDEYLEAITEARVTVAGLGLVMEIGPYFDAKADELATTFLATYSAQIKKLSDDRKETYRQIIEMSSDPQSVDLAKPESRYEATKAVENGNATSLPTWKKHLLCDKEGNYPAELNDWERAVLEAESKRLGFRFWYRNPQQPGQSSLGVAYQENEEYKIVRPDFVFFAEENGKIVADLVDPHGTHLADALPKLKGMAEYAKTHAASYRRIESLAQAGGKLRVLDLTRPEVQAAVSAASNASTLYEGFLANDYG